MAKKTKRMTRDLFEEKTFFDRDEARRAFWERYEIVKNDSEGNFQVLMYYGLGGMGKTSLLQQIGKEIDEKNENILWEYYDFNEGQDSVIVLKKIVKDLQNKYKFKFPLFNYAVYNYLIKCGENANAPEVNNVLDDIPGLRKAIGLLNLVPGVNAFSQSAEWLADRIFESIDFVKKKKMEESIEKINNSSKEKLHDEIPYIFAREINDNLERKNNPVFVLMFDTYERLVNELLCVGTPLENDLWLRDDNDGILLQINNMLCVIAGREKLKWNTVDPDWDDEVLGQVEIDTLDWENSKQLMIKHGINESEIQREIFKVTSGMPLYLDVCVDTYKGAKLREDQITVGLFDNKIEKLAMRLLTYMNDEEQEVLYLLACIGRWEDEEFFLVNDCLGRNAVSSRAYKKILALTFVRKEESAYFIHQTMQEILIKYCDEENIERFIEAIMKHIENENMLSNRYYKYVYIVSKICEIRKNDKITRWWVNEVEHILENYLDSFCLAEFLVIYSMLAPLTESYVLKTLYLKYLLKKGDYKEAFEYIHEHMNADENDINTLKFYFAASYYYYINGEDKEAFRLRCVVHKKREKLLGVDAKDTIRAGLALAASYSRMGFFEKSIELGNRCREKLSESLDAYDSIISAARNQLGDSYFRLGNFEQALKIYQEVYEDRCRWLGKKNNSAMIAYNHIADCLVNMGKYEEALAIYEEVKKIRKSILNIDKSYYYEVDGKNKVSNDHPDTIIVENNMSVCLINMSRYSEAVELLKEVVAKRRVTLNEGAPATLGALENLAMCEFYSGMKEYAAVHISEVVKALTERLGVTHYDVIIARYHQALINNETDTICSIIRDYAGMLKFNSRYIGQMKDHQFIGYFSLGRYYE